MSEPKTKTQSVDSIFGFIAFGGTEIPIGFLTSFAKPSHTNCMGRGLTTQVLNGKKVRHICPCTVSRAAKRLRQIGTQAFAKLGDEWLVNARANPHTLPADDLPGAPADPPSVPVAEPPKEST